jgi:hypothetical protein
LAPPLPNCEPTEFIAGDTIAWTRDVVNYPIADGWLLHYRIVGPSDLVSQPVVTIANNTNNVVLAAAATADPAFLGATYRMMGWVDGVNAERHIVFDGFVEILPNVAVQSFAALQTHEERMLAACQAALEGRLTNDVARYGREGTFVDKLAINDILKIQGVYKAKLWRLENPGESTPRHVVRFGPANGSGISRDEAQSRPGYEP